MDSVTYGAAGPESLEDYFQNVHFWVEKWH